MDRYCIIMSGLPASGKSSVAKVLSRHLGIPVIAKDDIKEILFDTVGFESREGKVNLGTASEKLMYYCANLLMDRGQSFILDNNFENSSRIDLESLLERHRYPAITVQMTGDPRMIYQRFIRRNADPMRHTSHIVNLCYPATPESRARERDIDEETYISRYVGRGMNDFTVGQVISVDSSDISQVNIGMVLDEIDTIIEGNDD